MKVQDRYSFKLQSFKLFIFVSSLLLFLLSVIHVQFVGLFVQVCLTQTDLRFFVRVVWDHASFINLLSPPAFRLSKAHVPAGASYITFSDLTREVEPGRSFIIQMGGFFSVSCVFSLRVINRGLDIEVNVPVRHIQDKFAERDAESTVTLWKDPDYLFTIRV